MTSRELLITKSILNYLHDLDGGQATELEIHAGINAKWPPAIPKPMAGEVEHALKNCDTEKWVIGVAPRFGKHIKWNITDAGEGARQQMP